MSSILEKARADLQRARDAAHRSATEYKAAVAKVKEAEKRVQRLEVDQVELDIYRDKLQRTAQGQG